MNKLTKLLNEYQERKNSEIRFKRIDNSDFFVCGDDVGLGYETILSKKFGFIKRLVDNDKIGRNKNSDRSAMIDLMRVEVKEQTDVFEGIEKYEWYIMILSIQESPIEFLISILK